MMKVTKVVLLITLALGMHTSRTHVIAQEETNETIANTTTDSATTTASTTSTTTPSNNTTSDDNNDSTSESESINDNEEDNDELSLEDMSNEELEAICTGRGFEIVKEVDENGNDRTFSRAEYMDAATQCLEIEAEMEQILNDHPHLLDEIENEADQMRKEKLSLEEQLAEAKAKLALEEEGERFKAAFDDGNANDGNDNNDGTTGEEEIPTTGKEPQKESFDPSNNNSLNSDEDDEVIDLDDCCEGKKTTKQSSAINEDQTQKSTGINNASNEKTQEGNNEETYTNPQLAIGNESHSPITVKDLFMEFKSQIQKDFVFIGKIVFPEPYREPVMEAVRTIIVVGKNALKTVYKMVKRYAVIFL